MRHTRFQAFDELLDDVRFGARLLRKQPTFTVGIVLMLALGIGLNATVFSWLETVVLDPLPGVSDPGSLVAIVQADDANPSLPLVTYPDFEELTRASSVFAGVIGSRSTMALLSHDGRTDWVSASVATANVFERLGVQAKLGRTFRNEEDVGEGQHPVAILGESLWQREFGADDAIIGRTIRLNQQLFTVVGVVPASFRGVSGGSQIDVWTPLSMHEAVLNFGSYTSRSFRWIHTMARLRPGVGLNRAEAALALLSAQLAVAHPESNAGVAFKAFPLWKSPYGGQAAFLPALRIVLAMTGAVLLIVIANVCCLLLARAALRHTEVMTRVAIGAGRSRLVRQFLTESLMLASAGGAAGGLFARWAVRLLPRLIPVASTGFVYDFSLSGHALAFTAALTITAATVFGLVPALAAQSVDVAGALRGAARGSTSGPRRGRLLGSLVVMEVALALVLLVGAALCLKGFQRAARVETGFNPDNVLFAGLNLVPNGYSAERARNFDQALARRLRSAPGIVDAAFVNTAPLGASRPFTGTLDVEGREARASESRTVPFVIASAGYLSVMRIPLLQGRDFEESDDETRQKVALVNDAMARRYWPGQNPIGRRFRMAVGIAPAEAFVVIGVCGTSKYTSLAEPPTPMVYVTYPQRPIASLFMNVVVRSVDGYDGAAAVLRRELHAVDPAVEPLSVAPLPEYIQSAFVPVRVAATLLAVSAAVALALAATGLYAVMSYGVNERVKEIGIRIALGARTRDAMRLVLARAMTLVAIGIAIGQVISLATAPLLAGFLYGVSATDPVTLIGVGGGLAAVGFAASALPTLRVAGIDPVSAMRSE